MLIYLFWMSTSMQFFCRFSHLANVGPCGLVFYCENNILFHIWYCMFKIGLAKLMFSFHKLLKNLLKDRAKMKTLTSFSIYLSSDLLQCLYLLRTPHLVQWCYKPSTSLIISLGNFKVCDKKFCLFYSLRLRALWCRKHSFDQEQVNVEMQLGCTVVRENVELIKYWWKINLWCSVLFQHLYLHFTWYLYSN